MSAESLCRLGRPWAVPGMPGGAVRAGRLSAGNPWKPLVFHPRRSTVTLRHHCSELVCASVRGSATGERACVDTAPVVCACHLSWRPPHPGDEEGLSSLPASNTGLGSPGHLHTGKQSQPRHRGRLSGKESSPWSCQRREAGDRPAPPIWRAPVPSPFYAQGGTGDNPRRRPHSWGQLSLARPGPHP